MSSDPTAPPTDRPDPVVDFVVRQRSTIAYVLLVLGFAALAAGIYFTVKAWPTAAAADADAEKKDAGLTDLKKEDADGKLVRSDHVVGAVAGFALGVVFVGVGSMMLLAVPKPTPAGQITEARVNLLSLGSMVGLALMITALLLFWTSFDVLVTWADEKVAPADAWKPVTALLVFLAGAGAAFLGAQPARAEERNNPTVRRLVYGTNLVLTVFLLVLVLLVGNVIVALKVPNRLDTTESGFYTLQDETKKYLAGLTSPVKAYTTFPEDESRVLGDARRLLEAAHEVNPSMVQVRFLSPALNQGEITALRNRFPQADLREYGILLTAGEDEKQYSFIRAQDLIDQQGGFGGPSAVTFVGEQKLIGEILFLSESKTRPVVYFTTGHGELEVIQNFEQAAPPGRAAGQLRSVLEKAYVDVRPLEFALGDPKVPADAAIVAILDPRAAFPPDQVAALRKYVTEAPPGGKKGKLIVATSPHPRPDGTGVVETGLEGLLGELGVRIGQEYLYTQQTQELSFREVLVMVTRSQVQARNPIALEFAERGAVFTNCREVTPAGPPGAPQAADVLLGTFPEERATWFETDPQPNPARAFAEMVKDPALAGAKRATNRRSRPVAAVVTEGTAGRAAVYGSGEAFADPERRGTASNNAELFAATVNWLRDRPAVANIASKTYGQYTPNRATNSVPVFWLPTLGTLLGITALGLGVWMFRRK